MSLKTKFPAKEGWLTLKMTLKKGTSLTEDDAKNAATWGKPERAEFGHIDVSGNPVVVIFREIKSEPHEPTKP